VRRLALTRQHHPRRRAGGQGGREMYLPKYEKESAKEYKRRLESTPWRPEFVDALRNLCAKPFTKEVTLQGEVSSAIKTIAEDVDGQGNNLHAFARETFVDGVAMGLAAIYVTFPDAEPAQTQAEEKASGVRPYWVDLCADDIIALYTKKVGGRDVVQHIRWKETVVTQDKFAEKVSERIRVIEMDPASNVPTWYLYEKQQSAIPGETVKWAEIGKGTLTVPEIPIVLYFTGERSGNYRVKPPLIDLANMQIEIYRALSREDEILTYAGSPMLKAKGLSPPQPTSQTVFVEGRDRTVETPAAEISIGPKTVLFAPPSMEGVQPDWDFIQPNAANITAVQASVDNKIQHFRQLALQPQTASSGRLTATSAAIDAAKAHSAVQVWANSLKDALEQAFVFTCMWLKAPETVEVSVNTDFQADLLGVDDVPNILAMVTSGQLSLDTAYDELTRRSFLGPQFDKDKEPEKLASDQQGMDVNGASEPQTDPKNGKPIAVAA
jgi:hypothetical protein